MITPLPSVPRLEIRVQSEIEQKIAARFGVLPNFFRLASEEPEITRNFWGFAQFAYLDNPLPALFKERLFVYLSRFCRVRYCIARHLGFLVGLGRPAGDKLCTPQSAAEVFPLLQRTLSVGTRLDAQLEECRTLGRLTAIPEPESAAEQAVFAFASHVFLQTADAPRTQQALGRLLNATSLEYLNLLLAFVRTAHYWTEIHPDLKMESDIEEFLAAYPGLSTYVLGAPEDLGRNAEIADHLEYLRNLGLAERGFLTSENVGTTARLELALRASRMGTFAWRVQEDRYELDRRMLALLGLETNDTAAVSKLLSDIFCAEDNADYTKAIARAIDPSGAGTLREDLRVTYQDGSVHWLSITAQMIFDDSRPIVMYGMAAEITEQKQAEQNQRDRNYRETFLLALGDALGSLSDPAAVQGVACSLLGKYLVAQCATYSEVPGTKSFGLRQDTNGPSSFSDVQSLSLGGEDAVAGIASGEPMVITDAAADARISAASRALFASLGVSAVIIVGIVRQEKWVATCRVQSTTPRQWTLTEIELVRVTAQRIWEFSERVRGEAVIAQTQKMATLGRLAASIAHEINNPLEALTNIIFLAQSQVDLSVDSRATLQMADAELRRIAHTTRQVLGFYSESGSPVSVSIIDILNSSVELLSGKIAVKNAIIEREWLSDQRIYGVAGELRHVFSSLLINSLDAIKPGGTIRLRVAHCARFSGISKPGVRVTVADNGSGIASKFRTQIFEPLFTTKGSIGNGLGLWISKQIVQRHGGSIRMRTSTEIPSGTVFSVFLPLQAGGNDPRDRSFSL